MDNKQLLKQIITNNKAHKATIELYNNKFEEDLILELICLGQLGKEKNKKSMTQKQANTMYDKTISEYLVEKTKQYEPIKNFEIYNFEKYENNFLVILIPEQFSLEFSEKSSLFEESDYLEFDNKLKTTKPNTAGALYSVQLGILEMLEKRAKQARILILRYMNLPQGIGSKRLREISRECVKYKIDEFNNIDNLFSFIKKNNNLHFEQFKNSIIVKDLKKKRIDDYF